MPHAEEPDRKAPDATLSLKMSGQARRNTRPEVALRRELHTRGLRFRVQLKVPVNQRRTIDIAFTRAKLAVFVDGCFWHACPQHGVRPKANAEWWDWKLDRNVARDADTSRILQASGWTVLRFWEHEDVQDTADQIQQAYSPRLKDALP